MISSLCCSRKHHLPCSFTGVRSKMEYCCYILELSNPLFPTIKQISRAFIQPWEWWIIFNPTTSFHRYNIANQSLFYHYFDRKCSDKLYSLVLQFRTLQQGPTMPCPHSLHIPLVMKKLHLDSFFPRATALWNRLQKDASPTTTFSTSSNPVNHYLSYISS